MKHEYYSDSLVKTILFDPIASGADRLCILSFHAKPSMALWLLTTYKKQNITDVSVELIIEAVINEGIDEISHEEFKELHRDKNSEESISFSCSYLFKPPISENNLYIWLQNDTPIQAFKCSCDFTQALLLKGHEDSVTPLPAVQAYELYEDAVKHSIFCNHSEVDEYCNFHTSNISPSSDCDKSSDNCVRLSLITRTGEPGKHSGLNWGQRNKRNKNEAYIPLPSKIAKSGFFPLNKQHFLAVTDDHRALLLRVEQQNDKAITTPTNNALFGEYFRNRLGLANGAYVHFSDLEAYGRTDVTFYKIDDDQYYMDFCPGDKR